jgi:hypothetical protein
MDRDMAAAPGFECLSPKLRRVVTTGHAVRLAMAA